MRLCHEALDIVEVGVHDTGFLLMTADRQCFDGSAFRALQGTDELRLVTDLGSSKGTRIDGEKAARPRATLRLVLYT